MVNEVYEVQQYLAGNDIVISNLYRTFTLLIKWFKEQGFDSDGIRNEIQAWAKSNGIFINYDLNNMIMKLFEKNAKANLESPIIKINENDMDVINKKFDNKKTKLTALAMLCYAKAYANKKGEFSISTVGLSAWTGLNRKVLSSRYIKELIEFKYLSLIEKPNNNRSWEKNTASQSTKYRINHKLHNSGNMMLKENNLEILFLEVF